MTERMTGKEARRKWNTKAPAPAAGRPGLTAAVAISIVVGLVAGVSLGYLLAGPPTSGPLTAVVRIAIQPTATPETISPQAEELEKFLERRLGPSVDVEIFIPTDYTAAIGAIEFDHAEAAMLGAWPAAIANKRAGAEVVLAERRAVIIGTESRVEPYYYSSYVVMKSSAATTLNDTAGKTVCYTSKVSTSGYLFPVAKLVELGLIPRPTGAAEADPGKFFGRILIGGGYQQCWEALKRGEVDVGVIAGDVSERLYNEVRNATRPLETQGPIPSHAVVFSRNLREPLRSDLRDAFLALGTDENRPLMRKLVSGIFVEFTVTTTETHLAGLNGALTATNAKFS